MTKLKQMRKKSGQKLRMLAEKLNVTPQTVQQQEQRGIKTLRVAERYAKILNCDPLELLG